MLRDLAISAQRVLPAALLSVRFSRSGGPGGQHVNKVETKADIRLELGACAEILGDEAVRLLQSRLRNRLDGEGNLRVVCSKHREQGRNVAEALSRMESLVREALVRPKRRAKTRPTRGSRERRLADKKRRSRLKKDRSNMPEA